MNSGALSSVNSGMTNRLEPAAQPYASHCQSQKTIVSANAARAIASQENTRSAALCFGGIGGR